MAFPRKSEVPCAGPSAARHHQPPGDRPPSDRGSGSRSQRQSEAKQQFLNRKQLLCSSLCWSRSAVRARLMRKKNVPVSGIWAPPPPPGCALKGTREWRFLLRFRGLGCVNPESADPPWGPHVPLPHLRVQRRLPALSFLQSPQTPAGLRPGSHRTPPQPTASCPRTLPLRGEWPQAPSLAFPLGFRSHSV